MMSQEVLCVVTGPPTPGGPPHRLLPHYLALRPTFHCEPTAIWLSYKWPSHRFNYENIVLRLELDNPDDLGAVLCLDLIKWRLKLTIKLASTTIKV